MPGGCASPSSWPRPLTAPCRSSTSVSEACPDRRFQALHLGQMTIRPIALALALVAILIPAAPAAAAGSLPSHFGLGLAAQPDATGLSGWLPQSGVPWDYAYQYLAGG